MDAVPDGFAAADYGALVRDRKCCDKCRGVLCNPAWTPEAGGSDLARFDTDEIGPWSAWIGRRPAKLMLVGQDWGTVFYYVENEGRDYDKRKGPQAPNNLASKNLLKRLNEIGIYDPDQEWRDAFKVPVFLTNAVLCLKMTKTMSGPVQAQCLSNCRPFLQATIRAAGAKAIIALGETAYKAVLRALDRGPPRRFADVVNAGRPIEAPDGPPVFVAYHPSVRARNRDERAQQRDWMRIGVGLREQGMLKPCCDHPPETQRKLA